VYTWDAENPSSAMAQEAVWWVENLVLLVFNLFWVYPLFFLAKIVGTMYYQEVANAAYRSHRGAAPGFNPAMKNRDMVSWLSISIADLVYSTILQLMMLLEASLLLFIPRVGPALSIIYSSWIMSLYCFEYTWLNAGWSLEKRLEYFERHWLYFLGFGLPFTLPTSFLTFLYNSATFAVVFPIYIIIATVANPIPSAADRSFLSLVPESVPIFTPIRQIANQITRMWRGRKGHASVQG